MPARTNTPRTQIAAEFAAFEKEMTQKIVHRLQYVGEECVNEARKKHSYCDQTGNLTSSIGFLIAVDGGVVFESFKGATEAGKRAGIQLARDVIKSYPNDVVLVFVAGMDYASHVANRGYDVIDSAETLARKLTPKMLKQIWK